MGEKAVGCERAGDSTHCGLKTLGMRVPESTHCGLKPAGMRTGAPDSTHCGLTAAGLARACRKLDSLVPDDV